MRYGLLGQKLSHSYSPQIHGQLGDYAYGIIEKEPEEVATFLKNADFSGINVTVPYKKTVIAHLDMLTDRAAELGAVNTVVNRNGNLIGHNTDFFGFQTMLQSSGLDVAGKKVLVLGSGGASNTVVSVLKEAGAKVIVISRSGENNYENLHLHKDATVIVNTTPLGTYPNTGISAVSLDGFPRLEGVLDVVYNPARTKLLLDAEDRGLVAVNGLLMLVAQAKEASEWFMDRRIDDSEILRIHRMLKEQMENIILVGMPGCGKSTLGKLLAERTGKTFIDADTAIEEKAGISIREIFATSGEEGFRAFETEVLADLGKQSGLVIATGGGCVTQERNYRHLHQNGTIYWLQRDIGKLPTDGRPLSQANKLEDMYQQRKPMYQRFADHIIDNDGDLETTIQAIMKTR